MKSKIAGYITIFLLSGLFSCNNPGASVAGEKESDKGKEEKDSATGVSSPPKVELKKLNQLVGNPGAIGVYEVPEMLTLCRKDSASTSGMAQAFARNFSLLEKDLAFIGLKSQGAAGSIYYNNDTSNLIFECVFPIASIPKKQPKNCSVVALEASPMLIYNHYGEYSELNTAYENVRRYLSQNGLVQAGPMREFYMTDPVKVTDHDKWLTRIMVPVMRKK